MNKNDSEAAIPRMMRLTRQRDALLLGVAAFCVASYVVISRLMGATGLALDDSWIHQVYARNLAQTGLWAFIPGRPSAAATSPLYVVLLAIGYWMHLPYLFWTFSLGALFLAMLGWFGARLAQHLFPAYQGIGLWAGLTVVLAWHFIWASAAGMETTLFVALELLNLELALRQANEALSPHERFWGGLAFGLSSAIAIAARPEGYLLTLIIGAGMIVGCPDRQRGLTAWLVGAVITGLIAYAPLALLNLSLNGSLLPDTVAAKQAQNTFLLSRPFLQNLWSMIEPMVPGVQLALLPSFVVGIWMIVRQQRAHRMLYLLPLLWGLALVLLFTLRLPGGYQHSRYIMSSLSVYLVISVGGAYFLLSQKRTTQVGRILSSSYLLLLIGYIGLFWIEGARTFADETLQIDGEMVKTAQWIEANIPPQQILANHDIGAVGYFASSVSQPRPLLDIAGLLNPEVVQYFYNPPAMFQLMQAYHVRWVMVVLWSGLSFGEATRNIGVNIIANDSMRAAV